MYGLDYRRDLQPVVAFVQRLRNLRSTGRQGHFGYTSMYQSIEMGRSLGAELAAAPAEEAVAARRASASGD